MTFLRKTGKKGLCLVGAVLFLFVFLLGACASRVEISLNKKELSLETGESYPLVAAVSDGSQVAWSSSDENIVSVSSDGRVTGVSPGNAVVTASCSVALATCKVTVILGDGNDDSSGDSSGSDSSGSDSSDSDSSGSDSSGSDSSGSDSSGGDGSGSDLPGSDLDLSQFDLYWADEFEGSSLDLTKWGYQTGTQDNYYGTLGPSSWGNDEMQYYTEDAVKVENGALVITAEKRDMGGRQYTSARILTRDLATFTYGYFEARMKTPALPGMWPAFWMLPQPTDHSSTNNVYGGWAANGEIDIMEAKGRLQNVVDTTLHFGGGWPTNTYRGDSYTMQTSTEEWHTYGVDWRPDSMSWYIDGVKVYELTSDVWYSESAPDNDRAPFDQPFYLLLNLAVGGRYDGYVSPSASFTSASMYVDYVRVYKHKA